MRTETITFEKIKHQASKRVSCPECGERRAARRTFTQTVNPFNPAVVADEPYREQRRAVRRAVMAEVDAWEPSVVERLHDTCYRVWQARQATDAERG